MSHCVVTGANRGIGLELAKQLHQQGHQVTVLCRQPSAELNALGVNIVSGIDVSQDSCIEAITQALAQQPVDLLINNAGILRDESLEQPNWATIREQFEVNTLGPLRVTHALLPNLVKGAKVALITSRMGSIADNTSGGRYGYRLSKAALNAVGKSMAMDLRTRDIAVSLLHPGYVATGMTGNHGDITPDVAASRLLQRIDEMSLGNSGSFFHSNGDLLPW